MPASLKGLVVLVVDDNCHVQEIWHAILAAADALHIGAGDTPTALDVLSGHAVGIVVVDYHLAENDCVGAELIASIRRSADPDIASIPILACTSDGSASVLRHLECAGANAVLLKPIVAGDALVQLGSLNRRGLMTPDQ